MVELGLWDPVLFLTAFGGGLFGASIGALPAFILTGIMVIAGEMLAINGGVDWVTGGIAFGTFFAPNISFAGGVAAAAFAAKKGILANGKDIATPLMTFGVKSDFWQVLVVGGIFGIIGHIINASLVTVGAPTDTIAVGVWVSALIARLAFGSTGLLGKHDASVSPSRMALAEDRSNAWLPFMSRPELIFLVGIGVGMVSGWISILTGSAVIGFGIAAFSLIFLETKGPMPVTHHIALPAALAALAVFGGGAPVLVAVLAAGLIGVISAFLAELHTRFFLVWGDTFVDPPAFAIFVMTTVVILVF
ncbi:hypothetical protein [Alkalispirochaeta alkalica]|uniref:hypothetical protein n=1 Tax=Alkalispirochaeta alkalica TaxID=46356 RepID=UPI00039BFAD1|nr:hypothetical protein [Alkalispirochaeta alkalica]